VALYTQLRQVDQRLRLRERSLVHGDLHMSNVALDTTARGPEAYIFDPGVMRRSADGLDLATLEVSIPAASPA
jgi:fructosamine-3-kinase